MSRVLLKWDKGRLSRLSALLETKLRIVEQAAGHLRWEVDYPPSQPVGSGFEPHWRPQPAKLPSFGGYSLETLSYLTSVRCFSKYVEQGREQPRLTLPYGQA